MNKTSYSGYTDYIRQLSADGMWEYGHDANLQTVPCVPGNNNQHYPAEKIRENPLTGFSDLDRYPLDLNGNGFLVQSDQQSCTAERTGTVVEWKFYDTGNPRQFYKENDKLGISTNPPAFNRINMVGENFPLTSADNNRVIYPNGIEIKDVELMTNGDIKVEIKFNQTDIENHVTWAAPSIVLNELPNTTGNSLNVKSGRDLTIDHGTAPTGMDNPITLESEQVFTDLTVMEVEANADINIETYAEIILDRKSELVLKSGSSLNIEDLGILRVKRGSRLVIEGGALLNVEDGGSVIIEEGDGIYGAGQLVYEPGARINLEGSFATIDLSGGLHVADNAVFTLANSTDAIRTSSKLIVRDVSDAELTFGTNTEFGLLGYNRNQEVLVHEKSILFPNSVVRFVLRDLTIKQGIGNRIAPFINVAGEIDVINVKFSSITADGEGLQLYGHQDIEIKNCYFDQCNRGIYSYSSLLGNGITIKNSVFFENDHALTSLGEFVKLINVDFIDCAEDWRAVNMSSTSTLQNVEMTGTTGFNLDFEGNAKLLVENSSFEDAPNGVNLDEAISKFKCSGNRNHTVTAFEITNSGGLVMNALWNNNKITDNNTVIQLVDASTLKLNNGSNDLRPNTYGTQSILNGNLICPPSGTSIVNQNVWNNAGTAPSSSDYDLTQDCPPLSAVMTITDNSPLTSAPYCLSGIQENGNGVKPSGAYEYSKDNEAQLYLLETTTGLVENTGYASLMLNETLDEPEFTIILFADQLVVELDVLGMILSDIYPDNQISVDGDEVLFQHLKLVAEIHSRVASLLSEDLNLDVLEHSASLIGDASVRFAANGMHKLRFYSEMDLVEFKNQFESTESALNFLELISTEELSEEMLMVYERRNCHLLMELSESFYGPGEYLEWMSNCVPGSAQPPAIIETSNLVEVAIDRSFDLYPNPAGSNLTVLVFGDYLNPSVRLSDLTGRQLAISDNTAKVIHQFDISRLPNGTYVASVYDGDLRVESKIFVVSH